MSIRLRDVVTVLVVALLLALAEAAAAGAAPATFAITGTVTAEDGTPLAGICVDAGDGVLMGAGGLTRTAGDGTYRIDGLPADSYRVEFRSCAPWGDYLPQVYDGKPDLASATPVRVVDADVTGIDAKLVLGGAITGRVTDAGTGDPIADVCVTAYDATAPQPSLAARSAGRTGPDGTYRLGGLPTGSYTVSFIPCAIGDDHLTQFANAKPSFASADPVSVTMRDTISDVDAALVNGGEITGHVYRSDGTGSPVGSACVNAEAADGTVFEQTRTRADGSYRLGSLPAGAWRVHVPAPADCPPTFLGVSDLSYPSTFANEVTTVNPGSTASGVDVHLPVAAAPPATTASPTPSTAPSTSPLARTPTTPAQPAEPAPRCVVPSLKNKTLAQAKKLLAQAHCGVGKVTRKANRKVKKGRVASQAKRAKTRLTAGTRIDLVLSRGRR